MSPFGAGGMGQNLRHSRYFTLQATATGA